MESYHSLWLNAATYKPALAKTLLTLASEGHSSISWEDLANQFLKAYEERLGSSVMPQQGTPGRITKLEKTVAQLNTGKLARSDAISIIANEGFNDVVPRFHTIGRDTVLRRATSTKQILASRYA